MDIDNYKNSHFKFAGTTTVFYHKANHLGKCGKES